MLPNISQLQAVLAGDKMASVINLSYQPSTSRLLRLLPANLCSDHSHTAAHRYQEEMLFKPCFKTILGYTYTYTIYFSNISYFLYFAREQVPFVICPNIGPVKEIKLKIFNLFGSESSPISRNVR